MQRKFIHFLITPSSWEADPLLYRRHRFAAYLRSRYDTWKVVWISPYRSSSALSNVLVEELSNGILQVNVPDWKGISKYLHCSKPLIQVVENIRDQDHAVVSILWYTYPAFSSLTKLNGWEKIVYDCSDMWSEAETNQYSLKNKIKRHLVRMSEDRIILSADYCIASSEVLYQRLMETLASQQRLKLIENGVDLASFRHRRVYVPSVAVGKPTLGFIGGLKPWKIDFSLLLRLSGEHPEWDLILIGDPYGDMCNDYRRLLSQPNVRKFPRVSAERIPEVLETFDVGLLPYRSNSYNRGVFPLKFFEYLASGLPVVGYGLPSTLKYVEEGVYYHTDSYEKFIKACEDALLIRNLHRERRVQLAEKAGWDQKFEDFWATIQGGESGA